MHWSQPGNRLHTWRGPLQRFDSFPFLLQICFLSHAQLLSRLCWYAAFGCSDSLVSYVQTLFQEPRGLIRRTVVFLLQRAGFQTLPTKPYLFRLFSDCTVVTFNMLRPAESVALGLFSVRTVGSGNLLGRQLLGSLHCVNTHLNGSCRQTARASSFIDAQLLIN